MEEIEIEGEWQLPGGDEGTALADVEFTGGADEGRGTRVLGDSCEMDGSGDEGGD